jgi:hypothetical protein
MDNFYARAVFFVADAERAMTYYVERFGFTLDWDSHDGVFQVSLFGFELIVNQSWPDRGPRPGNGRVFIGLEPSQDAPFQQHVEKHGIKTEHVQWGRSTTVIRDLDNNELFFWMSQGN